MSHIQRILAVSLLLVALVALVACGDEPNRGSANDSAASKNADGPGLIAGLLDSATDLLPGEGGAGEKGAASSAEANQPGSKDPIVKCRVKGEINFTRQSVCDNRGGQSERMALKVKNAL